MATAVITSSIFQELQAFNHSRRSDLQQLASALQSGNLDAAKQVFNDLATIGKSRPYRNAEPFAISSRAQAFEAIVQALQSGNLAGAQAAFAALKSNLGNHGSAIGAQPPTPAVIVNIGGGQSTSGDVASAESIFQQLQAFRLARRADLAQLGAASQSGRHRRSAAGVWRVGRSR